MSEENNQENQESTENVHFDILFQMGVVKMGLTDDYFCAQLTKYLGDEKDLYKFKMFSSVAVQSIFQKMVVAYKQYGRRPSEEQIRQMIHQEPEKGTVKKPSRSQLHEALDKILERNVDNGDFYRENMQAYVTRIKYLLGRTKVNDLYKTNPDDAPNKMQEVLDDLYKVSFQKEDVVTLDDLDEFLEEASTAMAKTIPTGIPKLDADLHGGLPRESLITVLAGTNVGKSMFCVSLGANALRATDENGNNLEHKVLFVALEGMRSESVMRFASNLADVEYGRMISDQLSDEEKQRIKDMKDKYRDRLLIRNMLDFNVSIEKLMAELSEIYKDFPFTMCIIDYGQLLETQKQTEGHRFTMAVVYRGLAAVARKYNCCVISPVQATRQGQENQSVTMNKNNSNDQAPILRSADISEAFEIARVSGIIMSLNMTDDERKEGKLRVFLEKQRHGVKGNQYGILTNFNTCNLITKNFYDPSANMVTGDVENYEFSEGKTGETIDLAFALGETASIEQQSIMERMNNMIGTYEKIEEEIKEFEEELETEAENNPLEMEDPEGNYVKIKEDIEQKKFSLRDTRIEYLKLFKVIHENPSQMELDAIKEKVKYAKENMKADDEKRINFERLEDRYEMGMNLLKIQKEEDSND